MMERLLLGLELRDAFLVGGHPLDDREKQVLCYAESSSSALLGGGWWLWESRKISLGRQQSWVYQRACGQIPLHIRKVQWGGVRRWHVRVTARAENPELHRQLDGLTGLSDFMSFSLLWVFLSQFPDVRISRLHYLLGICDKYQQKQPIKERHWIWPLVWCTPYLSIEALR